MFREHEQCWDQTLRNLCREMFLLDPVSSHFFLTGSAALAVFWLGHRKVDNLDFFTTEDIDFHAFGMYLKNKYGKGVLAANDQYILLVEAGNKVSFAKDHLSLKVKRPTFCLDGVDIRVDTLENLIANKMSAFVSRFSRNDALDVMCLLRLAKDSREMAARMILGARRTEVLAEDTRYVASLLEDMQEIYPDIAKRFDREIDTMREVITSFDAGIDEIYR